jgi:hypothetical protein
MDHLDLMSQLPMRGWSEEEEEEASPPRSIGFVIYQMIALAFYYA